jgi:hypothetical protein
MNEVQFPEGSRHAARQQAFERQMSEPITPTEQPTGEWPDEAACKVAAQAQVDVDELASAAQRAGLGDVQRAAEDAVSALEHLDRVLTDHYRS